jgi:hypothetical protein
LGCDIQTLFQIFTQKMDFYNQNYATLARMTWKNIHIDHIKPVSRFDLDDEDEFLACCHYTNLQPLLPQDNLQKSNQWNDDHEKYWKENIRNNSNYLGIYLLERALFD